MEERERGTVQISFGDVLLRAPETDDYLAVAAQILEMRRRELASASAVVVPEAPERSPAAPAPPSVTQGSVGGPAPAVTPAPAAATTPASPTTVAPELPARVATVTRHERRARWFHDRFPQVTLEDGSVRVVGSLEDLRELLRSRGLQPHPRGDASMLLWQVRNRLNLGVEAVSGR